MKECGTRITNIHWVNKTLDDICNPLSTFVYTLTFLGTESSEEPILLHHCHRRYYRVIRKSRNQEVSQTL